VNAVGTHLCLDEAGVCGVKEDIWIGDVEVTSQVESIENPCEFRPAVLLVRARVLVQFV
jgi:hypothetical protein